MVARIILQLEVATAGHPTLDFGEWMHQEIDEWWMNELMID